MTPAARSSLAACLLAVALASVSTSEAADHRIEIWMSAFIPDVHPGLPDYLKKTDVGTHVLKGPLMKGCFGGDDRGFAPGNPQASARARLHFVLTISGRNMTVSAPPGATDRYVGTSHYVDCKTGAALEPARTASPISLSIGEVKKENFARTMFVRAAVANPYYPHLAVPGTSMVLGVAPDIDFSATLRYDLYTGKLSIEGAAGYFPSFEAYYRLDGGPSTNIVQWAPHEDSTAMSLIDLAAGINTRNFSHSVTVR